MAYCHDDDTAHGKRLADEQYKFCFIRVYSKSIPGKPLMNLIDTAFEATTLS